MRDQSGPPKKSELSRYIAIFVLGLILGVFFLPKIINLVKSPQESTKSYQNVRDTSEVEATRTEKIDTKDTTGAKNTKDAKSTTDAQDVTDATEAEDTKNAKSTSQSKDTDTDTRLKVEFGERYSTPEEVAYYLHLFKELPANYITKKEAYNLGWEPKDGNLWEITDEMSIGGDTFGNREGLLPEKKSRTYFEADVNYFGGHRGGERLVYSNDGLIFYSEDHYENFEPLYEKWAD